MPIADASRVDTILDLASYTTSNPLSGSSDGVGCTSNPNPSPDDDDDDDDDNDEDKEDGILPALASISGNVWISSARLRSTSSFARSFSKAAFHKWMRYCTLSSWCKSCCL